ncbi:MAG: hypothetical protein FWC45_05705, partial [Treponema sp.]|nr:hypothetical protein [Treponema sp.]
MKKMLFGLVCIVILLLAACSNPAAPTGGSNANDNDSSDISDVLVSGATLGAKFNWLIANAESNTSYTIEVTADDYIVPPYLSFSDKKNITISLNGIDSERTIILATAGPMFLISANVTLILNSNITLRGSQNTYLPLVQVQKGGSFVINEGAKIINYQDSGVILYSGSTFTMNGGEISGGRFSSDGGGGVYMAGGAFTMNGGDISGNATKYGNGGGVYLADGIFTMNGGEIFNNSANYGGGVYLAGGTFIMNKGKISGNTSNYQQGGGVYVAGGNFMMNAGEITGNTAVRAGYNTGPPWDYTGFGGGVYIAGGTFTLNGGGISGNTQGGVFLSDGKFTMNGGEIKGNIAGFYSLSNLSYGGGVYMYGGIFILNDGEISDNTAYYGGGVYIRYMSGGSFTKAGGTITGYVSDPINGNASKDITGVVQSNMGHAV